jgi:hypothetical protein
MADPNEQNDRIVWAHHEGDSRWHAIARVVDGGSAETYCNGRWPAEDAVALDIDPPQDVRCDCCDLRVFELLLDRSLRA